MKLAIVAVVLLLGGCASQGLQGMTAEQIKAAGKDGTVIYTEAFTPWGRAKTIYFNVDSNVVKNGSFSIDKEGMVQFTNSVPTPPIPQPAVKPGP